MDMNKEKKVTVLRLVRQLEDTVSTLEEIQNAPGALPSGYDRLLAIIKLAEALRYRLERFEKELTLL